MREAIELLTDEELLMSIGVVCGGTSSLEGIGNRWTRGLSLLMKATIDEINARPGDESIAAGLIVAIAVGWRAREIVAERMDLERLVGASGRAAPTLWGRLTAWIGGER